MIVKECRNCNNVLPLTNEFFYRAANGKDGFNNRCVECIKEYSRKLHASKPKKGRKRLDPLSPTKVCPKCGIEKSKGEYFNNRSARDGKSANCKPCQQATTNAWRQTANGQEMVRVSGRRWRSENPDRVRANKKRFRDNNPESAMASVRKCWEENYDTYKITGWRWWLKKKYGLTEERYYELADEQEGRCAICKKTEADSLRKKLCVDHCHKTGKVRGLLCFGCNVALGNMNDRIDLLEKCIEYLRKHEEDEWLAELEAEFAKETA